MAEGVVQENHTWSHGKGCRIMVVISISNLKGKLSDVLNRVAYGRERIVVSSHGKPKAAVISVEDLKLLEEFEEAREAAMLSEAIASETDFYSVAEVEAELAGLESDE
jgi:prevent-host-death family protein